MSIFTKTTPEALVKKIRAKSPADAPWVFDCDGTLIKGDVASFSAWALIRLGLVRPELLPKKWQKITSHIFTYVQFQELRLEIIAEFGMAKLFDWECTLHAGLPPINSLEVARFALKESEKTGLFALNHPLSDLAAVHSPYSWIVSGSPKHCVTAVGEMLGIDKNKIIGTRLKTVDGIQSNAIDEPGIIWEGLKRNALEAAGVDAPFLVAGDTIGDWAMMEMSTHFVWCVLWGSLRYRGDEFRKVIEDRVFDNKESPPTEAGFYSCETKGKSWIFEIK